MAIDCKYYKADGIRLAINEEIDHCIVEMLVIFFPEKSASKDILEVMTAGRDKNPKSLIFVGHLSGDSSMSRGDCLLELNKLGVDVIDLCMDEEEDEWITRKSVFD